MLPPGDATPLLVPATGLPVLRLPVAVLAPARLAAGCDLAVAAPETGRLAREATVPLFGFPPDPAIEERPTLERWLLPF